MIKKSQISKKRTLLYSKYIFKIRKNINYTQIPEINFINNFSIIVYNIILKIILSLQIIYGLYIDQIYIETVFLEKDFPENEYIYLKYPKGIDFSKMSVWMYKQKYMA